MPLLLKLVRFSLYVSVYWKLEICILSENMYPEISTATHSIDFAKANEAAYEVLAGTLNGKDIGVLGKS